jgi:acyl-coenzyme A thioesterase PaaI-like protein
LTARRKGHTVGLTVDFLTAAHAQELLGESKVLRRGSSLCFCEAKAISADDGVLVATALVTYKLD